MCYTRVMSLVELPRQFMRVHDLVAVFTAAQNMAKYTRRKVQPATLAKKFRERMGLMSSRDAYVMIHRGTIVDCPVSTHVIYRETAIWNKSLGDLKDKGKKKSRNMCH